MAQSGASLSPTWQAPAPTWWDKTKSFSSNTFSNTLKPGFNKAYAVVDKLGAPVNRLSNRIGSEAFWPTTYDKESEKCARILRTFCKDGFYDQIDEEVAQRAFTEGKDITLNVPSGTQRNVVKIPAKVIQNAVGLAIFTVMRTGWVFGGSGGAGLVVARHPETREWSPPSGIQVQNLTFGFLAGVDIFDTVLVINSYKALEAFMRLRCTLGAELGVVAGPVGAGTELDMEIHKKPAPVWSYVKSRGLYAGIALAGNAIIERTDENAKFYGYDVKASDILAGNVRRPPEREYRVLTDTLKAAQGDNIDESLLPSGESPSDYDIDFSKGDTFGIPAADDDDPYGVKALKAEGFYIREAGTHRRPSAETFEFNPAPSSPIYKSFRKSVDGASLRRKTDNWRSSTTSLSSMTRSPQLGDKEDPSIPTIHVPQPHLSRKDSPSNSLTESPIKELQENPIDEANPIHQARLEEDEQERQEESEVSDIDSDAEIVTAITTAVRPRVVQVSKPAPPALPPRNPGRSVPPVPGFFTVKLKTGQNLPEDRLFLRTSTDNWAVDRKGELKDGVFHFKLDASRFSKDFECKFVVSPNRWMHDPNLLILSPAAGEDTTFTDSRVIFDPPTEEDLLEVQKSATSVLSDGDEDAFVSVPPTPNLNEEENKMEKANAV